MSNQAERNSVVRHTPEPWQVHQDASGDVFVSSAKTSFHIAEIGSEDDETVIPDARRIVACVNAMAGIGDDNALFFQGNSVRSVISNMKLKELELKQQCDELLAALDKLSARGFFSESSCANAETNADMAEMRAAIAKAKGETA